MKKSVSECLNYQEAINELLERCETYVKQQKYKEDEIYEHEDDFQNIVLKKMLDEQLITKSMYDKLLDDYELWEDLLASLTEGYENY